MLGSGGAWVGAVTCGRMCVREFVLGAPPLLLHLLLFGPIT